MTSNLDERIALVTRRVHDFLYYLLYLPGRNRLVGKPDEGKVSRRPPLCDRDSAFLDVKAHRVGRKHLRQLGRLLLLVRGKIFRDDIFTFRACRLKIISREEGCFLVPCDIEDKGVYPAVFRELYFFHCLPSAYPDELYPVAFQRPEPIYLLKAAKSGFAPL